MGARIVRRYSVVECDFYSQWTAISLAEDSETLDLIVPGSNMQHLNE